MRVGIIRYGMGNAASVAKAFQKIGAETVEIVAPGEIDGVSHLVLPGVGAFAKGIRNLSDSGLKNALTRAVIEDHRPILGICLGMQLMLCKGTEPEETAGLGWLNGIVRYMDTDSLAIPHNGWNDIIVRKGHDWLANLPDPDMYFIHSYACTELEEPLVAATVDYAGARVAAFRKDNILATQFHPEKSQEAGLEILRRFLSM